MLALVPALGVRGEYVAYVWSPAVRAARAVGDAATVQELLAVLEPLPDGQLTPLLRAERDLALARRAGDTGDPGAEESFRKAVAAQRRFASPYHLAQALLDHAEFLAATGEPDRAEERCLGGPCPRRGLGRRPRRRPSRPDQPDARRRAGRVLTRATSMDLADGPVAPIRAVFG